VVTTPSGQVVPIHVALRMPAQTGARQVLPLAGAAAALALTGVVLVRRTRRPVVR
jgi:LPXTG-motif cell wall-anchored protein